MKKKVFLFATRWFGVLGPCEFLIKRLVTEGYEVYILGNKDDIYEQHYKNNCELIELPVSRRLVSVFSDIKTVMKLYSLLKEHKPVFIHSFNPKPVISTIITSFFYQNVDVYAGITGMGNTFIKSKLQKVIAIRVLKTFLKRAKFVMFQNMDDISFFKESKLVSEEKARLFIGPGVDVNKFLPVVRKNPSPVNIVCACRFLWQKGLREFVEMAERIKKIRPDTNFILAGHFDDDHPDRVPKEYILEADKRGTISFIGWLTDMPKFYSESDIAVLFSYREGAPRGILEPMASALPCLGANSVGVRDLIAHGKTGYIVDLENTEQMDKYLLAMIDSQELRQRLGEAGRRKVEEHHSLRAATDAQYQMYIDGHSI